MAVSTGLDLNSILQNLSASSVSSKNQAKDFEGLSAETLGPVLKYFKTLIGGDEGALMSATTPERARVIDQYDTARKAISEFGPRGGGTNATLAGSRFQEASDLAGITSQARTNAVSGAANLGMGLTQAGLSSEQLANQDLGAILSGILGKESLDVQKRGQNAGVLGSFGEALGSIFSMFLPFGKK